MYSLLYILIILGYKPIQMSLFLFDIQQAWNNNPFYGYLIIFLLGLLGYKKFRERLIRIILPAAKRCDFDDEFYAQSIKTFTPMHVLHKTNGDTADDIIYTSLEEFTNGILLKKPIYTENTDQPKVTECYFLEGRTGIGKTTFLLNLYHYYHRTSRFKNRPQLILGKMFTGAKTTWKEIEEAKDTNNTIILLDAMDEFLTDEIDIGVNNYRKAFAEKWKQKREVLKKFKKVIITVREQIVDEEIFSQKFGGATIERLELQPFNLDQIKEYLHQHFLYNNNYALHQSYINLCTHILETKSPYQEFITTPLLLGYIEDFKELLDNSKRVSSKFDIYENIVKKWIQRELIKIRVDKKEGYENDLQLFYENIAFTINQLKDNNISIDKTTYQSLEQKAFLNKTLKAEKGFSERTLFKSIDNKYQFIHLSFLEHFMVLRELRLKKAMERIATNISTTSSVKLKENGVRMINFSKYPEAAKSFMLRLWKEKSKNKEEMAQYGVDGWIAFLDSLRFNQSAFDIFIDDWKNTLDIEDPNWSIGIVFPELTILSEDFWNKETNSVRDNCLKKIKYLKNLITKIDLRDISIKGTDLSCFDGIKNLHTLLIARCPGIRDDDFKYFRNSNKIEQVYYIPFDNVTVKAFDVLSTSSFLQYFNIKKIEFLDLRNTSLTYLDNAIFTNYPLSVICLHLAQIKSRKKLPKIFEQTTTLEYLFFEEHTIIFNDFLSVFGKNKRLTCLFLWSIKHVNLKQLYTCFPNLKYIDVTSSSIDDRETIAVLRNMGVIVHTNTGMAAAMEVFNCFLNQDFTNLDKSRKVNPYDY